MKTTESKLIVGNETTAALKTFEQQIKMAEIREDIIQTNEYLNKKIRGFDKL